MQLIKFETHDQASAWIADQIISSLIKNPNLILCMASGDTPAKVCEHLVSKLIEGKTDYSKLFFLGLDEWYGIGPEDTGSCAFSFYQRLINPLGLQKDRYHFFNALSDDPASECKKMDDLIEEKGGIDFMLVGVGMNGHIGFNEPGTPFDIKSHIIDLDEITINVGQKYFSEAKKLEKGITIGLGHLLNSKTVIVQANGIKKAEIINRTVNDDINESLPSSVIRLHTNGFLVLDHAAASLIEE